VRYNQISKYIDSNLNRNQCNVATIHSYHITDNAVQQIRFSINDKVLEDTKIGRPSVGWHSDRPSLNCETHFTHIKKGVGVIL